MKSVWRWATPLVVWAGIALIPHPSGLSVGRSLELFLLSFTAVIVALMLEPLPPGARPVFSA